MSRVFYVLVFLLLISKSAVSVPSCAEVLKDLAPCLKFLQGEDVTPQCCSGLKNLATVAKTKADRVASCNCGKKALSNFDYDPKRFPLLPKKCGVDYNMPAIDKNFDCSKVELKHLL
ncbi:Non-specific lipid-transfer protein [Sesamum angolense]|uniref:Non-specific lipid-transfer protein n=1 Tax=Sesamum angolense TaxID=2727404 RepID=A0AAE2C759_9LAMI|nr:Non-specific lipid-transfer protein [Sesamum angolense]